MQLIDIMQIINNTDQLEWEKEAYQQALDDVLDIESYYGNLHIFGNAEQKAFYAKKYQEAYEWYCKYGDHSYPEEWEKAGFTKEEWDSMKTDCIGDMIGDE